MNYQFVGGLHTSHEGLIPFSKTPPGNRMHPLRPFFIVTASCLIIIIAATAVIMRDVLVYGVKPSAGNVPARLFTGGEQVPAG